MRNFIIFNKFNKIFCRSASIPFITIKASKEKDLGYQSIKYSYTIFNYGPSSIENLVIKMFLPQTYSNIKNTLKFEIIKLKAVLCENNGDNCEVNYEGKVESESTNSRSKRSVEDLNSNDNRTIIIQCENRQVSCIEVTISTPQFAKSFESPIEIDIHLVMNMMEISE